MVLGLSDRAFDFFAKKKNRRPAFFLNVELLLSVLPCGKEEDVGMLLLLLVFESCPVFFSSLDEGLETLIFLLWFLKRGRQSHVMFIDQCFCGKFRLGKVCS